MSVQTDYYIPQIEKLDAQISLQARTITNQRAEIARLRAALKPFAGAVFNDNGDMTISPVTGAEPYKKAYFAMRQNEQLDDGASK